MKTNNDVSAAAMLNDAREYHEAANGLLDSKPHLTRPINALYFHTVELALKAYLRAHNKKRWGHEIAKLYRECHSLGLAMGPDDQVGLGSLVGVLETGNEDMGFRYFTLKGGGSPEMRWTREAVGQLMSVVAAFVASKATTSTPRSPVKILFTVGQPYSQEKIKK